MSKYTEVMHTDISLNERYLKANTRFVSRKVFSHANIVPLSPLKINIKRNLLIKFPPTVLLQRNRARNRERPVSLQTEYMPNVTTELFFK